MIDIFYPVEIRFSFYSIFDYTIARISDFDLFKRILKCILFKNASL